MTRGVILAILVIKLYCHVNLLPDYEYTVTLNFPEKDSAQGNIETSHQARVALYDELTEKAENYTYSVGEHGKFTCVYKAHIQSENELYAMQHSQGKTILLSHKYVQRALTSILNRCFDKSYSKYRFRICPSHSFEQYLKDREGEVLFRLGFSNATDELEAEKNKRVDRIAALKRYNAIFEGKLGFIINDVGDHGVQHIYIKAAFNNRSNTNESGLIEDQKNVQTTINNHLVLLTEPMKMNGLSVTAFTGNTLDQSSPILGKVTLIDNYVFGKYANFFHCYKEADTLFFAENKLGMQIKEIADDDLMIVNVPTPSSRDQVNSYFVVPHYNRKPWIQANGIIISVILEASSVGKEQGEVVGTNTNFKADLKEGDIIGIEVEQQKKTDELW